MYVNLARLGLVIIANCHDPKLAVALLYIGVGATLDWFRCTFSKVLMLLMEWSDRLSYSKVVIVFTT